METTTSIGTCARFGRRAAAHGRRGHVLRDIAVSDRVAIAAWHKRLFRLPYS